MINYAHLCHVETTFVFNCACQKNFPVVPFMLTLSVWGFGHRGVPRIGFFSSTPLHPPAIRFSTIAPYVASQLITQEKLAEDEA